MMKKESFELQKRIVGLTSKNKQQQLQWDQEQRGRCLGLAFEKDRVGNISFGSLHEFSCPASSEPPSQSSP